MHPSLRAFVRQVGTLLAAVGLATCGGDAPITAPYPASAGQGARIAFAPSFSASALETAAHLADFGITFDHVRVVLVRPISDTLKDTTVAFAPGQADLTLDLTVGASALGQTLSAGLDYTNAGGVVFHGQGAVQAYAAYQSAPAQQIVVQYAGPGATVAKVALSPKTATVVAPSPFTFSAAAFDASNGSLANTPFLFSSSDPTIATVSNTGIVTTTGKRGTVTITVTTPTGLTDTAVLTVSLPVAGISLVSGGGQTGKAGSMLPQPAVVRVTASDGVGVQGQAVLFVAPSGGRVGSTSVLTDANGLASTSLTLSSTLGAQGFGASTGTLSVSIPATATVGDPANVSVVSGSAQSDTVRRPLQQPLVVKVTDALGNALSNVTVNWAVTTGSGAVSAPSSITDATGVATIGYTLGGNPGTETITASVAGGTTSATFTERALAAGVANISIVSGNNQTGRVSQALAPLVIRLQDATGNVIAAATVSWTATNGTVSPAFTTTDATGQSSTTLTLGTVAGPSSVTATVNGRSVVFTETTQPGTVSKLVYATQPPATGASAVALAPSIRIALQDTYGNQTTATDVVTIALGANTVGGTLTGTLSRTAVAGIATFDDLKIDRAGSGYTLVASSGSADPITSTPISIGFGAAGSLVIVAGDNQTGTVNMPATVLPSVKLLDISGNPIAGAPVLFTPATGSGTVVPTTPVNTDASGIATLTSWTFGTTTGPQSLSVSSPGVTSVTIRATVQSGAPSRYIVTATPTTQIAGGTTTVNAQLVDAFNNTIPSAGRAVNFTSTGGGSFASPSATTNATGATPANTFTTTTTAGVTQTLTATDAALPSVTGSTTVTTVSGSAGRLSIVTQPSTNAQSGIPFSSQPAIQLQDANSNPVTQSGVAITVSIASGTGTLGGTLTAVTDGTGRATFTNLKINGTPGNRTLAFNSPGLLGAASSSIALSAGTSTQLSFGANLTSTIAGSQFSPTVTVNILDADGNVMTGAGNSVTLAITTGTGTSGATLAGITTVTAVNGVATFPGVSISTAGTGYTITATSSGLTSTASSPFTISPASPSAILILAGGGQTGTVNAPAAIAPSVKLVDVYGNVVPGAQVTYTPNVNSGTVNPSTAITTDAQGRATLTSWTFGPVAGPQSLTVSSPGVANITINATANPAAASRLVVITQPSSTAQSGAPFATQPVVQLQDQFNNSVRQSGVTVSASIASGGGTIGGTLTAVTDVNGQATFTNLQINGTAGNRTLSFTSGSLTPATSSTIALSAGAATHLGFGVNPGNTTAGVALSPTPTVQILDANGNTVTTANNSITLNITTGTGTPGATLTGTTTASAVNGVASFPGVSTQTAGTGYTLTATTGGLTQTTSTPFNASAGAAAQLIIATQPSSTAASGSPFATQPVIQLADAYGNTVSQSGVSVTAAIGSGGGTLGGTTSVVTDAAGRATFSSLSISGTAGSRTLSFTSGQLTPATSSTINVSAGAAVGLAFSVNPANTVAGAAITPSVAVRVIDASGNTVTTASSSITVAINTGTTGAVMSGTTTVSASGGAATFPGLSIDLAGNGYTLRATSGTLAAATSTSFAVTAGAASQLVIATQPSSSVQAGVAFPQQPSIQLQDTFGNTVAQSGVNVTASIATGAGTLAGTLTASTNSSGRATFSNLEIDGVTGNRTLRFASGSLATATSSTVSVNTGTAAVLAITAQPTYTPANNPITPAVQVAIRDAFGNAVTSATNAVTIAIKSGTGASGAVLSGTTTVSAVNGMATFSNLSIDLIGNNYQLLATSGSLTNATSNAFGIGPSISSVLPNTVDAVFQSIQLGIQGSNFVSGATSVTTGLGSVTAGAPTYTRFDSLGVRFTISSATASGTGSVKATTSAGTSNALPFYLYSTGTAPLFTGPSFGGGGGSAYSLDCPIGAVATGLNVYGSSSINRVEVICQTVTGSSRTFGSATTTGFAGGTGGSLSTLTCANGYVLSGIYGTEGGYIDSLGATCMATDGSGYSYSTATSGTNQGQPAFISSCPVGFVITGLQGGAGGFLDRTQIKCR